MKQKYDTGDKVLFASYLEGMEYPWTLNEGTIGRVKRVVILDRKNRETPKWIEYEIETKVKNTFNVGWDLRKTWVAQGQVYLDFDDFKANSCPYIARNEENDNDPDVSAGAGRDELDIPDGQTG
jgi:hypothetical protein